ncbi:MAG: proline dehydrogenase family protein, partial [Taibaiella sp.]|nr:proline dehydrogenase family protein [Taibaiella sp.]
MLPQFDNTEIAFKYRTNRELRQAQILFSAIGSPAITKMGMTLTKWAISLRLPIEGIVRGTIFRQFCGGETMEDAARTADMLGRYHVGVILDYGVEGKEGEAEFDKAVPEFVKAIKYAASKSNIPFISLKVTGFARFALLEKLHEGTPLTPAEQAEWQRVHERINQICRTAHDEGVMVLIDAEETWIQYPVNELCERVMERYNKKKAIIFNTFQMYTTGALPYLPEALEEAKAKGYILGAKLVRGAYMEKERKRAEEKGYPSPIQPDKAATDHDYDAAV